MFTLVAILMFAGALVAAGATTSFLLIGLWHTRPAARAGMGRVSNIPPRPPRPAATTIRITVRSVSAQPTYWRAAA